MIASDIIRAGEMHPARPWPRHVLTADAWRDMAAGLARQPELVFEALWADAGHVFALFTGAAPLLVSAPVEAGMYAALSPSRPAAAWFERMVGDLWGHRAADAVDARPWLDHGCWPVLHPMLPQPAPNSGAPETPEMLDVAGDALHGMRLGPIGSGLVGSGLVEPALIALTASGERVARMELRLGYAHKGTLALMRGRTPAAAAHLAGRLAGDVAHALAFARAAEAALGVDPPPRAQALRTIAAELERIGRHLGDIVAILDAAGSAAPRLEWQWEAVLRASGHAFGHRLLMDVAVPGGVAADLPSDGAEAVLDALDALAGALPALRRTWRAGLAGRLRSGGVQARIDVRWAEMAHSIAGIRALLTTLPPGGIAVALPPGSGEGLGMADGPRGAVWHWLRLERGVVADVFARDPAWLLLPSLEAAVQEAALDDLGLIAASFGASVSGIDL